jgi:riboflavin kinase/FMN adenylyltransferase
VSGASLIAAIGNFDGVHRGHRLLLARVASFASEHRLRIGAVVFNPHPRRFFRPNDPPFLITSAATRDQLLREAGVDEVISLTFDAALASQSPAEFVSRTLKGKLGLAGAAVGADFRFGKGREGDAAGLSSICAAYGVLAYVIEPLTDRGHSDKIGSTAIREAILSGAMDRAADMLGRAWSVSGVVAAGNKVGRTLGFPTANLTLGDLIEPRRAVYAVRATVDGRRIDGVANFGRKPTVGSHATLLEVHLFDFSGDIYGREIKVDFIDFIRDEMRFDGLDALKAQIAADCSAARRILSQSK